MEYGTNVILLNEASCHIDEDGNPLPIVLYCNFQAVVMPTQSAASLSYLTMPEIKACANMIVAGGNDTWDVTLGQTGDQYTLYNSSDDITVILTIGDTYQLELSDGQKITWEISDFLHDSDENGNLSGISFCMRDIYGESATSPWASGMNQSDHYRHCFKFNLGGTAYENTEDVYTDEDTSDAPIHTVTDSEASAGYVELEMTGRTYLKSIVVTDSGGTETTWNFDYTGYYLGADTASATSPSWYVSDFTQNTYKIGKALYNLTGSVSDGVTLAGENASPTGFGGMTLDTTNGQIKYYIDSTSWSKSYVFSEILAGTVIHIPVSSNSTVRVNPFTYSRNVGGYSRSDLRQTVLNTFINLVPIGWMNITDNVAKKSNIGNRSTETVTLTDKLWPLSVVEYGVADTPSNYDEGEQYPIFSSNSARIKHYNEGNGSAAQYWTRSAYNQMNGGADYFWYIQTNGAGGGNWSFAVYGIVLGCAV